MGRHRASIWLLTGSALAMASAAESAETTAYSYDALGRLVRVEHSGAVNDGVSAAYGYDASDNRTNVTVAGVPAVAGGSFEVPEVGSSYVYAPAGSPAAYAGNSGVTGNGSVWAFAAAPDGDQVAFLQGHAGGSSISLPVTGLTPGASYQVSFRIAARPGYWSTPLAVSFNGAALGSFAPDSLAFAARTTVAFTAAASSGTLVFATADPSPNLNTGLDLVTIAAAGAPPP